MASEESSTCGGPPKPHAKVIRILEMLLEHNQDNSDIKEAIADLEQCANSSLGEANKDRQICTSCGSRNVGTSDIQSSELGVDVPGIPNPTSSGECESAKRRRMTSPTHSDVPTTQTMDSTQLGELSIWERIAPNPMVALLMEKMFTGSNDAPPDGQPTQTLDSPGQSWQGLAQDPRIAALLQETITNGLITAVEYEEPAEYEDYPPFLGVSTPSDHQEWLNESGIEDGTSLPPKGVHYIDLKKSLGPEHGYRCYKCPEQVLRSRQAILDHYIEKHMQKLLVCGDCEKTFVKEHNLRQHKLMHTNPDALRCKHCGCQAYSVVGLQFHIRRKHPEEAAKDAVEKAKDAVKPKEKVEEEVEEEEVEVEEDSQE